MLCLGYLISADRKLMNPALEKEKKVCIVLYCAVLYLTTLKVEVGIYINGVILGECSEWGSGMG